MRTPGNAELDSAPPWITELDDPAGNAARAHALLEAAEDVAQVGRWEWVPSKDELVWSDQLYRIYGLEPGEVTPSPEHVFALTHPDDRARLIGVVESLRLSGQLRPTEYRIVLPGAVVRHLRAVLAVAEQREGRRYRLVGWVQDVTERRRAEREIGALTAVSESLAAWDALKPGAERLLAKLAEAMGFVAGVFWVPEGGRLHPRVLWSADGAGVTEFEAHTRRLRPRPGAGAAGQAWHRGQPVSWASGLDARPTRRREAAAREGVRDVVAIPALCGDEVLAVLELASREEVEMTERLVRSLSGIGHDVGRFLARRRGELESRLLTGREIEVLQLAARGLSGPEIAAQLVISAGTVRTHFENIYPKLGVGDRAAAVAQGLRLGLIE